MIETAHQMEKMIYIITGHRGTGKSLWLKGIARLYRTQRKNPLFFDLDEETEAVSGKCVSDLFKDGSFRKWETKVFSLLLKKIRAENQTAFIAVGAGLVFKKERDMKVIYLCRETDPDGRVFFNRPRILPHLPPLEESLQLYKKRQAFYMKQADEMLFRMEHFKDIQPSDQVFLNLKTIRPFYTLRICRKTLPENPDLWRDFLKKRMNGGARLFELNDVSADKDFIKKIRRLVPETKILFSSQSGESFRDIKNKENWSWDLSLGEPPEGTHILSLHERNEKSLTEILKKFSSYKNHHLKLAVKIHNLRELWRGLLWQRKDPENRSFLPRSDNGRWRWFRNSFPMPLHFIREGPSDCPDQPLFAEACHYQKNAKPLAGILGDPVHFSATPAEHSDFFYEKRHILVPAISLSEKEMTQANLELFRKMRFAFFAVTSPLKKRAFHCADIADKEARRLKSVNLLIYNKGKWRGYNTDVEGLKLLRKDRNKNVVVWGGGGVKSAIKKHLPGADFYSARKGCATSTAETLDTRNFHSAQRDRAVLSKFKRPAYDTHSIRQGRATSTAETSDTRNFHSARRDRAPRSEPVDVLVWAVGRKRMEQGCVFPPETWKPLKVIDLNYTDNSPGREYALKTGSIYESGWDIFKAQAKKQRKIFLKLKSRS